MSIEDLADNAEVWSEAIKKIVKAITAALVALIAGISGLMMLWGNDDPEPVGVRTELITGVGYTAQCSQLMNTIDHNWTEQQWSVWEKLRKDFGC